MADHKADVVDALRELAELTALEEGSPQSFRVRAYENAMRAVQAMAEDPGSLTVAQLTKKDGIGKSTAQKIHELVTTGRIDKLEALRQAWPRAVVELSHIPGVGPKAVKKLRSELGIESVADLRAALDAQKIRTLAGFGAKSEEKIKKAIERLGLDGKQHRAPIAKALPLASRLVHEVRELPGVVAARYCGSLRRFRETIGDLDIVVAADDAAPIMEWLKGLNMVEQVIVSGDTKTSVLTRKGLQVDLRVVAPHQYGAASLYFTGSKAHNIKLRQRAIARGMQLNEYALERVDGGEVVASETEEAIYRALDLPFIPAVLREDDGEIEAAERGELPTPLEVEALFGDLHVHTDLSGDGRSPLSTMVEAARARGYRFLAITEHAEALPMQGVGREALLEQRDAIRALQREIGDGLTLLHGIELNIDAEGGLDYDHEFRMQFDWCLASVHTHFDLSRERQTQRILAAMKDPSVNMIGHLTARSIGKRPGIELDIDAVLDAAEETGTGLEINAGLPRLDVSTEVLRRARGRDITFVMVSDAHHESELDRMRWGVKHASRGWLDPERLANTWSRERFLAWTQQRRSRA
ncbi:MAG: DNA polymerase/3'-5' exonuclease PolX [Myxococcales bacterium]|nr:DNA polymerase/3'-5' exonuclease PolX [Myxococcales bacterium]